MSVILIVLANIRVYMIPILCKSIICTPANMCTSIFLQIICYDACNVLLNIRRIPSCAQECFFGPQGENRIKVISRPWFIVTDFIVKIISNAVFPIWLIVEYKNQLAVLTKHCDPICIDCWTKLSALDVTDSQDVILPIAKLWKSFKTRTKWKSDHGI